MARLTDEDKAAFRELSERGWVQTEAERSPVFVNPTPEVNQAYCNWLSSIPQPRKPFRPYTGEHWKL